MEEYRTVEGSAFGELEEKHSRFIAQLSFADSEEGALEILNRVRAENRTARHNVYAYILRSGNRVRYSDDGEPAKTAGVPVLEVLQHAGLSDCILVVTRYFGGILLGTGGLVRAYSGAAQLAVQNAHIVTVRPCVRVTCDVDYALYERAAQLFAAAGSRMEEPVFAERVTLCGVVPAEAAGQITAPLTELLRGTEHFSCSDPFLKAI